MRRSLPSRGNAPALRFLVIFLGGWVAFRVAAVWSPAMPPTAPADAPWVSPSPFAAAAPWSRPAPSGGEDGVAVLPSPTSMTSAPLGRLAEATAADGPPRAVAHANTPAGALGADRHSLRLALMARLLPAPLGGGARSALPAGKGAWWPASAAARAEPGRGEPFWMQRQLAGWSLGSWIYLRQGGDAAPGGIASGGQLGGSQAGLRLAYALDQTGRARAFARATMAVQQPRQREVALGIVYAPVARWPIDVAVEQRLALGREGRTAIAATVSGGVSGVELPGGFRLDAYGQAGIVGARRRDGFVDGAVVIDHRLGRDEAAPLRVGALAAAAAQPGAARVDVGPRLTLRLPEVGEGSRIALDWRQRVAGDAAPESGLALTLAADF